MSERLMIYDETYIKLMEEIKQKRRKIYTQKKFAKIIQVSQKTVSCYENCKMEINLKQLICICYILEIDFCKLFYKELEKEYVKELKLDKIK